MRRMLVFTAVVVAAVAGQLPRADAGAKPAPVRIGMLNGMFRDVPPAVVQAAATPFRDLFKKQTGLDGDVVLIDDHETLAAKMKANELDIGVFHGFEFAWLTKRYPELLPLVVPVQPAPKIEACLVVHVDSKATDPSGLKGECVAIPTGTKAHCHLYVERLRESLPAGCCCTIPRTDLSPEEGFDAVVAGKTPAVLVDISNLTAYQNNKPGAAAQLRILAKSAPFPPAVIAYRKDALDTPTVANIRTGLIKAVQVPQGRAFLFLWKLKGFGEVPTDYAAQLDAIVKVYPPPAK